jgi:antitoxin HigA-1
MMSELELLKPIHPGDILKTEFLAVNNLTVEQLAQGTKLTKNIWQKLLKEEIPITYKLASHLSSYFNTSIDF